MGVFWGNLVPFPFPVRGPLCSPSTPWSSVLVVAAHRVVMVTLHACLRLPHRPYRHLLHTHLLAMSLNGAKCNLGEIKLKTILISGLFLKLGGQPLGFCRASVNLQLPRRRQLFSLCCAACTVAEKNFASVPPSGKYW